MEITWRVIRGEGGMEEWVQGIRSIIDRYKIDRGQTIRCSHISYIFVFTSLWGQVHKNHCETKVHKFSAYVFFYGFYFFRLYICFQSILSHFLCMASDSSLVSFFSMWLSNFPKIFIEEAFLSLLYVFSSFVLN